MCCVVKSGQTINVKSLSSARFSKTHKDISHLSICFLLFVLFGLSCFVTNAFVLLPKTNQERCPTSCTTRIRCDLQFYLFIFFLITNKRDILLLPLPILFLFFCAAFFCWCNVWIKSTVYQARHTKCQVFCLSPSLWVFQLVSVGHERFPFFFISPFLVHLKKRKRENRRAISSQAFDKDSIDLRNQIKLKKNTHTRKQQKMGKGKRTRDET